MKERLRCLIDTYGSRTKDAGEPLGQSRAAGSGVNITPSQSAK